MENEKAGDDTLDDQLPGLTIYFKNGSIIEGVKTSQGEFKSLLIDSLDYLDFGPDDYVEPSPQQLYERGICPLCLHDMWYENYCQECLTFYIYRDNVLVWDSEWDGWGKDKQGIIF